MLRMKQDSSKLVKKKTNFSVKEAKFNPFSHVISNCMNKPKKVI